MSKYVITPRRFTVEADTPDQALEQALEILRNPDHVIERDPLIEALEFYADPENYWAIFIMPDRPSGLFADDVGCVLLDEQHDHRHGLTARRALGDEWWGAEPCEEMLEALKDNPDLQDLTEIP